MTFRRLIPPLALHASAFAIAGTARAQAPAFLLPAPTGPQVADAVGGFESARGRMDAGSADHGGT